MMKMMNKPGKRVVALLASMMLMVSLLLPAFAAEDTLEPQDMEGVVILEDAELIGDLEEYLLNVLTEPAPIQSEIPIADTPMEASFMLLADEPMEEPAASPASSGASYDIQMEAPSGWYANRAVMEMTIVDLGETGWAAVRITMERSSGTVTLIDGNLPSGHIWIDLMDNCTVNVVITDPDGGEHSKSVSVKCFDKVNPTLTTSVEGEYLYIEAKDSQSGVAAIQVNGTTYTQLDGGKLTIELMQYADAYEQLLVQAVDKVGNVSKAIAVANPFYKNKGTPTPKPTATPKPSTPSKPSSGGSSNSSGSSSSSGNSGGSKATATPTPTPTATTVPTTFPMDTTDVPTFPTMGIEQGFPFSSSGNSFTRDLLYDKYTNKQFIAIETRNGDVFYIVIDYDKPLDEKGERYETFFLNLVDSRDLLDILGEIEAPEPEIVYVTPEPTVQPTPEPTQPEPEKPASGGSGVMVIIVILAAAGGALWYFKFRKPTGSRHSMPDYDDFDYDDEEDDEVYENEDE